MSNKENIPSNGRPAAAPAPTLEQSYAGRNPLKEVIPVREREKVVVTEAKRATLNIAKDLSKQKQDLLADDLADFMQEHKEKMAALAKRHSKTVSFVEDVIMAKTHYHAQRAVSLHNALIHHKRNEMNEGRPEGSRAKLMEIQRAVAEDEKLKKLSKSEQEDLKRALEDFRALHRKGARANNRAQTMDIGVTTNRIDQELDALYERTGAPAFGMVARGDINDTAPPAIMSSGGALEFIIEVLKMTPDELARKFELWTCNRDKKNDSETLVSLQVDCQKLILQGLQRITNNKNIKMEYENYDTDIKLKHKVELRGWPPMIKWGPPRRITTVDAARALKEALSEGDCIWCPLTRTEVQEVASTVEAAPKKKKKPRSDIGVKRGPRKPKATGPDGKAPAPPKAKAKATGTAKAKAGPKAKAAAPVKAKAAVARKRKATATTQEDGSDEESGSEESGDEDEEESHRPRKKPRVEDVAKMLPPGLGKSVELIESSDEEENDA